MRLEKDSLGELEVPADAYWGIHTARALVNFPITRRAISNYPDLIRGIARVKQAAARANKDIGALSAEKADRIRSAKSRDRTARSKTSQITQCRAANCSCIGCIHAVHGVKRSSAKLKVATRIH
ncbi:MAG: hypothetical protein VW015_04390, partial [Pontimonas sp.]